MLPIIYCTILVLLCTLNVQSRLAGECAALCNDMRLEVLTMEMCKEAKRTLPRPKVGDFCSNAMEQGYSDACVALCMEEKPVPRVAQTCRAAAIEMPRPTVRRWCEHGYNVAFQKTISDLRSHFRAPAARAEPVVEQIPEPVAVEEERAPEAPAAAARTESAQQQQRDSSLRGGARTVVATIPITIGEETKDLTVYAGQNAEDAVVVFCRENVAEDVSSCIRQLLPTVIEKLDEAAAAN